MAAGLFDSGREEPLAPPDDRYRAIAGAAIAGIFGRIFKV